jgi:curved DNA-binding protein CbpA
MPAMFKEKLYILEESDLYKVIGIEDSCEPENLNKMYRTLAKQYHPDLLNHMNQLDRENAGQIFTKITSAYNVLKDPVKRRNYDYERRLKLEYEKTIKFNQEFNKNSIRVNPTGPNKSNAEIKLNISVNTNSHKSKISEERKSNESDNLYNSAMNKVSSGDPDGAILDLQTAIVLNGKIARYHSCLGLLMNEKGWTSYAQAHFKNALNLDPNDKLANKYFVPQVKTQPLNNSSAKVNPVIKKEKSKGSFAKILEIILLLLGAKK